MHGFQYAHLTESIKFKYLLDDTGFRFFEANIMFAPLVNIIFIPERRYAAPFPVFGFQLRRTADILGELQDIGFGSHDREIPAHNIGRGGFAV